MEDQAEKTRKMIVGLHACRSYIIITSLYLLSISFNLLLKSDFECLFVTSECSLQSFEIRFEVRSDDLRLNNRRRFDWLVHLTSRLQLTKLDLRRKSSQRTSKQTSELCNEHSELTNKYWKSDFKSKLKSRVNVSFF